MWTEGESNPRLGNANAMYYHYTTGPGFFQNLSVWTVSGSNRPPSLCHSDALPDELTALKEHYYILNLQETPDLANFSINIFVLADVIEDY